jgi:hypothetical protein
MDIRTGSERILGEVDRLSGGRLRCRADLGILLGLGLREDRRLVLENLAFSAKFLARARGMMERIGPGGKGYDPLAAEFSLHMEKASSLIRSLLEDAQEEVRERFVSRYLALEPEALRNMLALCGDLGWYKNWLIDGGGQPSGAVS